MEELLGVAEFMLLLVVSAGGLVVDVPFWPALWSVELVVDAGCEAVEFELVLVAGCAD